ncbi:MAG TPA: rRNA maturation RNase YbeY [Gemmatimonadaceae bacterium]|nr:rRNA maturation RNase YbeY [Gemmatimonadaceae bacterium]
MSIPVAVSTDGVRLPLPRVRVVDAARAVLRSERVRDAMLSITFVSTAVIRRLNRRHLGKTGSTDVISFGFRRSTHGAPVVGDVYIAADVAKQSARTNGVSAREELTRLIVHGTLHVLGYDHPETDARTRSAMWKKQERIVSRLSARR